jgi:Flp pilus assembly protein TadG
VFAKWRRGVRRRFGDVEKGQSLVEVAIAFPILLMVLAGVLDLGRAYMTLVALNDAAAEGAAYAAIYPPAAGDYESVDDRVLDRSSALGLLIMESNSTLINATEGMVTITVVCGGGACVDAAAGAPVTVGIDYEYELLTPLLNGLGPITLQVSDVRAIMR